MDDKKKMMVLAGLVVVILGVGAFQFMQGPEPVETAKTEKASKKDLAGSTDTIASSSSAGSSESAKDPMTPATALQVQNPDGTVGTAVVAKLMPRDPFDGSRWINETTISASNPTPHQPVNQPKPAANPAPAASNSNRYNGPKVSGSGFKPLSVGSGDLAIPGVDPSAGGISAGKMPSIDDVNYQVSGTVNGKAQAAVFRDSSGNQRLVRAGDKLDPDTKVIAVSPGRVVIQHRGKTKVLKVEEPKKDVAAEAKEAGR
jgi:hypothetical protein